MKYFYKKVFVYCAVSLLVCGCAAPLNDGSSFPSSPSSDLEEPTWEEYNLQDLSGEPITPWSGDIETLGLSYALGWGPGQEGYIRLENGGVWGDAMIVAANSNYYFSPQRDAPPKLICNQNNYSFSCETPIPGILQVDSHAVLFFPYKSVNAPFFRIEPKDKDQEKTFLEETNLFCVDGTALEIKPLAVQFWDEDEETLLNLLDISDLRELSSPRWYDVEIHFETVSVSERSDNPWEILSTRTFGYLVLDDPLSVKEELFLPDLIWTGFAYWVFQSD